MFYIPGGSKISNPTSAPTRYRETGMEKQRQRGKHTTQHKSSLFEIAEISTGWPL